LISKSQSEWVNGSDLRATGMGWKSISEYDVIDPFSLIHYTG